MNQDDFLNTEGISQKVSDEVDSSKPIISTNNNMTSSDTSLLNANQIVERKMMTCTTFRIYPNGQMFVVKSQSWFDKKQAPVNKKKKKKKVLEKAKLQEKEEY